LKNDSKVIGLSLPLIAFLVNTLNIYADPARIPVKVSTSKLINTTAVAYAITLLLLCLIGFLICSLLQVGMSVHEECLTATFMSSDRVKVVEETEQLMHIGKSPLTLSFLNHH